MSRRFPSADCRRVFVHGVGAITALADDWRRSVGELATGRSAIAAVQDFDVSEFPCTVAAPIRSVLSTGTPDRRVELARQATAEALRMAGWEPGRHAAQRIGVFIGAESGRSSFATVKALTQAAGGGGVFAHHRFGREARELAASMDASQVSPAAVASRLAADLGARGPVVTVSLACASSASAIAEAARAIRLDLCDMALCGGVGTDVDPLMLAGFGKLGALSARGISCPFDVRRDGFVVGEGAAMIVLGCEQRAATVMLAGEGRTLDAYNLTAPDPEGDGAARAMSRALVMAACDRVDYVQAHGTSTPLNDAIEAKALHRVLGESLQRTHVSSVKGALGHWIAGAGALGFLCAHEALAEGLLLPTANLTNPDPLCDLLHVTGQALHRPAATALVNAFAFGGANCSLVLRRCA